MPKREQIRRFIEMVGWANPTTICYLLEGKYTFTFYQRYKKEMYVMRKTKDSALRLRLIRNEDGRSAFILASASVSLPRANYNHDSRLRNCLAKLIHENGFFDISVKRSFYDAKAENLYFEFDSGCEDTRQLENKIKNNYCRDGAFRVVFFMSSQYNNEKGRLEKLFEISKNVLKNKPNRILGCCYSEFLKDGKLFNIKREEKVL